MCFCGLNCCKDCQLKDKCGGCDVCHAHPFGGDCVAEKVGKDGFASFKKEIVKEINELNINGLHVDDMNLLIGSYVNLEYTLPNGNKVKYLKDNNIYLANQIEQANNKLCFGVVADESFILVCEYGLNGSNPKLILYKNR